MTYVRELQDWTYTVEPQRESVFGLYVVRRSWYSFSLEVTMAAPYSMDLRERVFKAWEASGDADEIAATFGVSRAWVHRLAQRQRETGSIAPRKQTKFRSRVLAGQEDRLKALVTATPDATLAELRDALPTTAALSTLWLELDRWKLTVKKNRTRRRTAAP